MSNEPTFWTEQECSALVIFADRLIPGGAEMPPASETSLPAGMETIRSIQPSLVEPTRQLLRLLSLQPDLSLSEIRAAQPKNFLAVAELVAGAYFLDERATGVLGYLEKPTLPLDPESERVREYEDLTRQVVTRGNIWRTTP